MKTDHVTIEILEQVTMEAMTPWFHAGKKNADKAPLLKELFMVAKEEQRVRNGEIGECLRLCFEGRERESR